MQVWMMYYAMLDPCGVGTMTFKNCLDVALSFSLDQLEACGHVPEGGNIDHHLWTLLFMLVVWIKKPSGNGFGASSL